jgi:phosphoribosylanthranilate isomerase
MTVRVKVCGITSAEDARLAVDAGADALGFIFVEGTPRFITPEAAARIIAELPPLVSPVGVFWDHAPGHVKAVREQCGLAALQFHGNEPPEAVTGLDVPAIKTIKVSGPESFEMMERYTVSAFLLDSPARWSEGESRAPIPWELVRRAAARRPIILSGGLTPDNVGTAVRLARPFAVDVDSGVEARPGKKDPEKVRWFIAAAKATSGEPA